MKSKKIVREEECNIDDGGGGRLILKKSTANYQGIFLVASSWKDICP